MKICPRCNTNHVKEGIFCSRKCANVRVHTKATKNRISQGVKNSKKFREAINLYNSNRVLLNKPIKTKPIQRVFVKCFQCQKDISVRPFEAPKRKFCDGKCRNIFNNKFICGTRSKAEAILEEKIKREFPQLKVVFNDRKILDGLELDVYFPTLKFAIEWNGVFHYKEIKRDLLEKNQIKDKLKIDKCKNLGIELMVIEDLTSNPKFVSKEIDKIVETISNRAEMRVINGNSKSPE